MLGGPLRIQHVQGMADLVTGARRRPGAARDVHRDAGQYQGLREGRQEVLILSVSWVPQQVLPRRAGHRDGQPVHRLAGDRVRQLPVRAGRDVGDDVADAGCHEARRGLPDHVQVDDDADRAGHPVGAPAGVVVEGRDRRADAVVGQVGGDRDQRQADPGGGVLGGVDDLAAAEADDRVVVPAAHRLGQAHRAVQAAVVHVVPVGAGQGGLQAPAHGRTGAVADRHRDPARGRQPLVREDPAERVQRARADLHEQRRRDQSGQYRHAISRAFARSSWLSTSTQETSPIGCTSIRRPRSTISW